MNHEKGKCPCARCEAIESGLTPDEADEQQREWQARCIAEFGFYVHYVGEDPNSPTGFNAHTHGLDAYNHPDFQLIIPLPQKIGHNIISTLAKRAKEGERFHAGQCVTKVIENYPVKLMDAEEDSRHVLRIILPDPDGKLEPGEINEQYAVQYADLDVVVKNSKPKPKWIPYKGVINDAR